METEKFKELFFINWFIKNRTAIYVFTAIISIAGFMSYIRIPKEQFPDIVVPTISVATIYPGNTPEDIENLITKPIEKQLKSINGVKKVTSQSISDVSIISVEFNTNIKVEIAKQKVNDAVDKAKNDLPTDLQDDPQVQEFDFSEFPIMNINIAGDFPMDKLEKYAKDLEEKIETLPEITRVDKVGGLEREIQINVDLYKMQLAGVTFGDIESAVARENVNISGGEMREGPLRRNLRVTGQFRDPKEIESIVVRSFQGNAVTLGSFAEVVDGFEEKQDFARLDGKQVITLNVIKRSGENLINASDKIKDIIDEYKSTKFPDGVTVTITGDQSDQTRVQLDDLVNTVIIGFILVLGILMFFMGFKSAFFVALAGPLSFVVAFLIMPQIGFTLNVIVLFSFLLALGIIVDDAIVVIENTHRIFHKYPLKIEQAAKYGAAEVFFPVLAGTMTTLGPFIPLLFWPGIVGNFMYYLPVTLLITLGASLFVAFIMNPVFAVSFMKKNEHLKSPKLKQSLILTGAFVLVGIIGRIMGNAVLGNLMFVLAAFVMLNHFVLFYVVKWFQDKFWPVFVRAYHKLVAFLTHKYNPIFVVSAAFILLFISLGVFIASSPKVNFFPDGDPNFVEIYCEMPMGTDANVTDSVTRVIEGRVYEVIGHNNPNVKSVITNIGLNAGDPQNPDRVATPHKSKVTIAFVKYADRKDFSTRQCLNDVREKFKDGIPGAVITVDKEKNGPPTGKPINIEISGDDFNVLEQLQAEMYRKIGDADIQGIEELRSDLQRRKPEKILVIDKEKAQREGISIAQIGMELRTALYGKEISKFKDANDDAPIMIRVKERYRMNAEQLMNVNISFMDMGSGLFKEIPIGAIAHLEDKESFNIINRKNQKRVITLSSNVLDGYTAPNINTELQKIINGWESIPEGYSIALTGEQEDQKETSDFLGVAFIGALALMFMVMVTQFNSAIKPLLIFSTVLFSLIGIFIGFATTGMTFSIVMTGVGVFALAGIVIRNGIILIEFIDELRHRGMDVVDAVVEAGSTRMTPVVLTALSTILGLIPLAVGFNIDFAGLLAHFKPHIHLGGDNVAFWGPLAWTMIFGLTVSTFLTLLVVPSMYVLAYKSKHKLIVPVMKKLGIGKKEEEE